MKASTREWIKKAEPDWLVGVSLTRRRKIPVHDHACFHFQQSAEKYLKARLEEANLHFPKTHDLDELVRLCLRIEPLRSALSAAVSGIKCLSLYTGTKWGTPDVIGVRVASRDDLIKFQEEVTSAEIKIDTQGLITAFGQACAYKLFSHRSYIVVPKASPQEDRDRLTALAQIFGIGLVFFNANSLDQPDFDIQVRATRNEPDYFYLNQNLRIVKDELF